LWAGFARFLPWPYCFADGLLGAESHFILHRAACTLQHLGFSSHAPNSIIFTPLSGLFGDVTGVEPATLPFSLLGTFKEWLFGTVKGSTVELHVTFFLVGLKLGRPMSSRPVHSLVSPPAGMHQLDGLLTLSPVIFESTFDNERLFPRLSIRLQKN